MLYYTGCQKEAQELTFEEYEQYNTQFKRRLIWHFGTGNGFYSELNGVLLGVLYAAQYGYQFVMYARDANAGMPKGWEDVFRPFCPKFTMRLIGESVLISTRQNCRRNKLVNLYKMFSDDITEDDVFWYTHTNRFATAEYDIPALGIKGDIHQAMKRIIPLVYRFNPQYRQRIDNLKAKVEMPENYIGIHIRMGDKANDTDLIPPRQYIEKALAIKNVSNTFIYTDNVHVINELKDMYPEITFHTLTDEKDTGYDMRRLAEMTQDERQGQLVKMFASIEILLCSDLFVGTFSSNPGMFIGMLLGNRYAVGVDYPHWLLL